MTRQYAHIGRGTICVETTDPRDWEMIEMLARRNAKSVPIRFIRAAVQPIPVYAFGEDPTLPPYEERT